MTETYPGARTPPQLLTAEELAEQLRMSPRGVRRLVERGELAVIRVSERQLRFTAEDVHEYLERKREAVIP
jgi:excisionase family DNA binding protein